MYGRLSKGYPKVTPRKPLGLSKKAIYTPPHTDIDHILRGNSPCNGIEHPMVYQWIQWVSAWCVHGHPWTTDCISLILKGIS